MAPSVTKDASGLARGLQTHLGGRSSRSFRSSSDGTACRSKTSAGALLGFAEPVKAISPISTQPAQRRARKAQKLRVVAVRELDASAPTIDPLKETLDLARELPKEVPAPIGALVTASDHARAIAQGVKESPKAKRAREEAERKREAETMHELQAEFMEKSKA